MNCWNQHGLIKKQQKTKTKNKQTKNPNNKQTNLDYENEIIAILAWLPSLRCPKSENVFYTTVKYV